MRFKAQGAYLNDGQVAEVLREVGNGINEGSTPQEVWFAMLGGFSSLFAELYAPFDREAFEANSGTRG